MANPKAETGKAHRGGRDATLDGFVKTYSRALTHFFQRRVRNSADVPDLVQDVFVRLARRDDLDDIECPERYLFSTASSALRDKARRDKVRQHDSHQEFDEEFHGGSEISTDRVITGKFAVRELHAVVARLPERTRDIFVLRVFEDRTTKEIATMLGISQRAVEKQHAKALARVTLALRAYRNV